MVPPCDGYVNEVPINRELRVKMPLFVRIQLEFLIL